MARIGTIQHSATQSAGVFFPASSGGTPQDKVGVGSSAYTVGFITDKTKRAGNLFTIDGKGSFMVDPTAKTGILGTSTKWGLKIVAAPAAAPAPTPTPDRVATGPTRPSIASTIPVGGMTAAPAGWAPKSGQSYSNLIIKGQHSFAGISNARFTNCVFDAQGARWCCRMDAAGTGNVFKSCEFKNMLSSAIWGRNYTAIGCYVHDSDGDGFKVDTGGNVWISGCYVHRLGKATGSHADGVQIRGGGNIRITDNFFDMPTNDPVTNSNASVFIQAEGTTQAHDITVDGNWCLGGNYTIAAYASKNISIIRNTFYPGTPRFGFGHCFDGVVWSGNVTDSGKPATAEMK